MCICVTAEEAKEAQEGKRTEQLAWGGALVGVGVLIAILWCVRRKSMMEPALGSCLREDASLLETAFILFIQYWLWILALIVMGAILLAFAVPKATDGFWYGCCKGSDSCTPRLCDGGVCKEYGTNY